MRQVRHAEVEIEIEDDQQVTDELVVESAAVDADRSELWIEDEFEVTSATEIPE
jgi:hypothetical protein